MAATSDVRLLVQVLRERGRADAEVRIRLIATIQTDVKFPQKSGRLVQQGDRCPPQLKAVLEHL